MARYGGAAASMRPRRGGASGHLLLLLELAGGTQPRRLRTGVGGDLAGRGHDGAPEDRLRLGRAAAAADRQVGRADAALGPVGQEALDAPVLERVEGDGGEAAAGSEDLPGQRERGVELGELVVDDDADGLERALGGMAAAE